MAAVHVEERERPEAPRPSSARFGHLREDAGRLLDVAGLDEREAVFVVHKVASEKVRIQRERSLVTPPRLRDAGRDCCNTSRD